MVGVSCPMRCAVGIAGEGVVWVALIGIAGQGVAWAALCCWDCLAGRRLGGAVSLGLLARASSGWRCVIKIAWQGVVWAAPCH